MVRPPRPASPTIPERPCARVLSLREQRDASRPLPALPAPELHHYVTHRKPGPIPVGGYQRERHMDRSAAPALCVQDALAKAANRAGEDNGTIAWRWSGIASQALAAIRLRELAAGVAIASRVTERLLVHRNRGQSCGYLG